MAMNFSLPLGRCSGSTRKRDTAPTPSGSSTTAANMIIRTQNGSICEDNGTKARRKVPRLGNAPPRATTIHRTAPRAVIDK